MTSNGSWYKGRNYYFKQYKTKACKNCPARHRCTTSKANGKILQRSEYTSSIEQNAKRIANNPETYRKRQALLEHPFGTIKRQWGFDHIFTKKGIQAASADFGLIALAYNLKRLIKLGWSTKIGKNHPNKAMKALFLASKILKNEILAHMTLLMKKNCLTPIIHNGPN